MNMSRINRKIVKDVKGFSLTNLILIVLAIICIVASAPELITITLLLLAIVNDFIGKDMH